MPFSLSCSNDVNIYSTRAPGVESSYIPQAGQGKARQYSASSVQEFPWSLQWSFLSIKLILSFITVNSLSSAGGEASLLVERSFDKLQLPAVDSEPIYNTQEKKK